MFTLAEATTEMRRCAVDSCGDAAYCRGWCTKHYQRWRRLGSPDVLLTVDLTVAERLWQRVNRTGSCWLWNGHQTPEGYGQMGVNGMTVGVHRIAYELEVGPIPAGLVLDHLCRVPNCVRPDHLEPVTHAENILRGVSPSANNARKTHCPLGHLLSGSNLYISPAGGRSCIICQRERVRRHRGKVAS